MQRFIGAILGDAGKIQEDVEGGHALGGFQRENEEIWT